MVGKKAEEPQIFFLSRHHQDPFQKQMEYFFTLMVTELLSSYLHSQRRQYASTSGPRTGMGSTT